MAKVRQQRITLFAQEYILQLHEKGPIPASATILRYALASKKCQTEMATTWYTKNRVAYLDVKMRNICLVHVLNGAHDVRENRQWLRHAVLLEGSGAVPVWRKLLNNDKLVGRLNDILDARYVPVTLRELVHLRLLLAAAYWPFCLVHELESNRAPCQLVAAFADSRGAAISNLTQHMVALQAIQGSW